MRSIKIMGIALGATLASALLVLPAQAAHAQRHIVYPGQSIQTALQAAKPGETVVVKPGVYRENLEITTDGITLIGEHAVLEPPTVSSPRNCSGPGENPFGLCVTGTLGNGTPPAVLRPVKNVTIKGMIVHRFPSTGIFALGADNVRIEDTKSMGGTDYGILLAETTRGTIRHAKVTGGDEAGIYIGDSGNSHTKVVDSEVSNSGIFGIFIRDSSNGILVRNRIAGNCVGIGFIATVPDANAVADWLSVGNEIRANNNLCPPSDEGGPALTGIGVLLAGTSRVAIASNSIIDNRPAEGSTPLWSGGIVMVSGSVFGGPQAPTDNLVVANTLRGNHDVDINVVDSGSGNRIQGNHCRTSSPAGLCSPHR